jgi:integrase
VFLDPTAVTALRAYEKASDEAFPEATAFLVSSCGRPLRGTYLPHVFAPLAEAAGIQAPPGQRAPRLHDLRHVFAVATLLDWYRDGGDVQARLHADMSIKEQALARVQQPGTSPDATGRPTPCSRSPTTSSRQQEQPDYAGQRTAHHLPARTSARPAGIIRSSA